MLQRDIPLSSHLSHQGLSHRAVSQALKGILLVDIIRKSS